MIRDDEGNPAKGVTIARELVEPARRWRWYSGGCTPTVALAQVPVVYGRSSARRTWATWAAGDQYHAEWGQSPNYVFRVSANDDLVDPVPLPLRGRGHTKKRASPGCSSRNTAWGQSNEAGLGK